MDDIYTISEDNLFIIRRCMEMIDKSDSYTPEQFDVLISYLFLVKRYFVNPKDNYENDYLWDVIAEHAVFGRNKQLFVDIIS